MRLLWLSPCPLWPLDNGGRIRQWHLVSRLTALGDDIEVWYLNHSAETPPPPRSERVRWRCYEGRARRGLWRKLKSAAGAWPEPVWISHNSQMLADVASLGSGFDAVVLNQSSMARYGGAVPQDVPTVLDAQNVESDLFSQLARGVGRRRTRARYRMETWKYRRLERDLFGRVDRVMAVSELDRGRIVRLQPRAQVCVHPNGVDTQYFTPVDHSQVRNRRLIMTGTLGYPPNLDAAYWARTEILPLVRDELPGTEMHLVGSALSPADQVALHRPADGFVVVGEVSDIRPSLAAADVFLIPLRMGAGTRLKALEAMSAGLPVVSTPLGVEGIEMGADPPVAVGRTATDLARRCVGLMTDSHVRNQFIERAASLVRENYDWWTLAPKYRADLARVAGTKPLP